MTIEELTEAYHSAYSDCLIGTEDGLRARRAGVTAIVRALRDEFVTVFRREYLEDASIETFLSAQVVGMLDQILGDAGEKVAEYTGGMNDLSVTPATDPAPTVGQRLIKAAHEAAAIARGDMQPGRVYVTDPAPAVCVWTGEEYVTYSTSCESEHEVDPHKAPPTYCPSCGLPIKFTEAK